MHNAPYKLRREVRIYHGKATFKYSHGTDEASEEGGTYSVVDKHESGLLVSRVGYGLRGISSLYPVGTKALMSGEKEIGFPISSPLYEQGMIWLPSWSSELVPIHLVRRQSTL